MLPKDLWNDVVVHRRNANGPTPAPTQTQTTCKPKSLPDCHLICCNSFMSQSEYSAVVTGISEENDIGMELLDPLDRQGAVRRGKIDVVLKQLRRKVRLSVTRSGEAHGDEPDVRVGISETLEYAEYNPAGNPIERAGDHSDCNVSALLRVDLNIRGARGAHAGEYFAEESRESDRRLTHGE